MRLGCLRPCEADLFPMITIALYVVAGFILVYAALFAAGAALSVFLSVFEILVRTVDAIIKWVSAFGDRFLVLLEGAGKAKPPSIRALGFINHFCDTTESYLERVFRRIRPFISYRIFSMKTPMKLTGWARLGIVVSAVWILLMGMMVYSDFSGLDVGLRPRWGMVALKEISTGKLFPGKSKNDVTDYAEKEERMNNLARMPPAVEAGQTKRPRDVFDDVAEAMVAEGHSLPQPASAIDPHFVTLDRFIPPKTASVLLFGPIASWTFLPLAVSWVIFFTVRWVVAGFRQSRVPS